MNLSALIPKTGGGDDVGQTTGFLSGYLEGKRLSEVKKWLTGRRILDCGCGRATLLKHIAADVSYVGMDSDKSVINQNKKTLKGEFHQINLDDSPLPVYGEFDSIILSAIIEHLNNPRQLLGNLTGVLSPEGRMIITTPSKLADKILRFGSYVRIFSKEAVLEHKSQVSGKNLPELINDSGLILEYYGRFELGLNQIIVLRKQKGI